MAINVREYLISRIRELYPDSATRPDLKPGSAFYDLLILPLAALLEDYQLEHQNILDLQNVRDPQDYSDSDLDAVAMNFLMLRNSGTKASGYVKFYFNRAVTLNIPKGTILKSSDDLEFETLSDMYVPKLQMEGNIAEYPYYDSGNIYVIAREAGNEYNKAVGTQFTLQTTGDIPTPAKIVNVDPFTSGTEKEGNQTFFDRIKTTVYNKSLASKEAIDSKLKELYPTIVKTEVVGAGNPLMIRDLANLTGTWENYVENDFYLTYSGKHQGTYDKAHIAYFGAFNDTDESNNVQIPERTAWTQEFSDPMYQGVYKYNDRNYALYDQEVILREDFGDIISESDIQPSLSLILASGSWQVHDGINPKQDLFYIDEIRIQNNELVLGFYQDPTAPDPAINVPLATISGIMDLVGSSYVGTTTAAYQQLQDLISPVNYNNVAPIIHRPIDQHMGIYIDLTMRTSDSTELGEMCYITVLRNSEVYLPQDGFGISWRKQPAWLIRIDKGTYTDEDIETFKEHYNDIDPVTQNLVGNLHLSENKAYWKYNVYLVDNDVLQEEVWVGHDQLWDQTSGKNQFLAAGKVWIEDGIDYTIRLKIYETLGFEGWVYDNNRPETWNSSTDEPLTEINRVLYRGATYPPYLPVSGDKVVRTNGVEVVEATYNHFGIGVAQTRNSEWFVDDLVIRSFIQVFPMHLFKFKIDLSEWSLDDSLTVSYYGVGYDPYLYAEDGAGHSSTKCVIYKPSADTGDVTHGWVEVGSHTNTIDDGVLNIDSLKITETFSPLSDYVDDELYVNIAVLANNSGTDFPDDSSHSLRSYYLKIDNSQPDGLHRGNMIDVYVHDPSNIKTATTVLSVTGNKVNTNTTAFKGYIVDIAQVREYISKVPFDRNSYSIVNNDAGKSYAQLANYDIIFDSDDMTGAMVEVEYKYWSQGDLVNTLLTSSDYRYPATDVSVKAMPIYIIHIEKLEYSGGLRADQMKLKLIDYFNALDERSFDKSDIVDVLYDNGANYVDLDMEIHIKSYDTEFVYQSELMDGQTYVIPYNTVGAFYTNEDELVGVEQV